MTPSVYPPPPFPAEGFLFSRQTAPQGGASRRAGPPGRPRSCRCGPCGARLASLAYPSPCLPFAPAFSLPTPCGGAARPLHKPLHTIIQKIPPSRAHRTPMRRTHTRARYEISPANSCLHFAEIFPRLPRRFYTPFIDSPLEKDYNRGW